MATHTGKCDTYWWASVTDTDPSASFLIRQCPSLVIGQYVVVTALDSGPLILGEHELGMGWRQEGPLAITPKLTTTDDLPSGGFDEWYIFHERAAPMIEEVFVNYSQFALHATPEGAAGEAGRTQERFWRQMRQIAPVTYLSDGCLLSIATRDEALFTTILEALA